MRLVGIFQAMSGFVAPAEEIAPPKGFNAREMVKEFVKRYQPAATPGIQQEIAVQFPAFPPFIFNSGTLESDGKRTSFNQLQVMPHIVGVQASTTDEADIVLADVITFLNDKFEFRINEKAISRRHFTVAVVEFDPKFSEAITKLKQIQVLIEGLLPDNGEDHPVHFKKLAFGRFSPHSEPSQNWETMNQSDFSIEARVGVPLSQNRFFCSAPLATKTFLEALRSIERILREQLH